MTTFSLDGYIARETDNAVAFVARQETDEQKPLWLPRKKIVKMTELDEPSVSILLAGNTARHSATPVTLEVDKAFLEKIGVI